ncbi:hypothetical protein [Mycoplasmopsis iners]|uniref:hypothetical protein n=1 Tax=Mycoplasmopsis iners TaxID=76630 RepID=UPI0004952C2D|nr:hypothetical protein [Mycoplasmopsis iners]
MSDLENSTKDKKKKKEIIDKNYAGSKLSIKEAKLTIRNSIETFIKTRLVYWGLIATSIVFLFVCMPEVVILTRAVAYVDYNAYGEMIKVYKVETSGIVISTVFLAIIAGCFVGSAFQLINPYFKNLKKLDKLFTKAGYLIKDIKNELINTNIANDQHIQLFEDIQEQYTEIEKIFLDNTKYGTYKKKDFILEKMWKLYDNIAFLLDLVENKLLVAE